MEAWLSIALAIIGVATGLGSLVVVGARIGNITTRVDSLGMAVVDTATKEQLKTLADRVTEDREHDNRRFAELYEARNQMTGEIIEVAASLKAVCDRLERIEPKLDELLRRGA